MSLLSVAYQSDDDSGSGSETETQQKLPVEETKVVVKPFQGLRTEEEEKVEEKKKKKPVSFSVPINLSVIRAAEEEDRERKKVEKDEKDFDKANSSTSLFGESPVGTKRTSFAALLPPPKNTTPFKRPALSSNTPPSTIQIDASTKSSEERLYTVSGPEEEEEEEETIQLPEVGSFAARMASRIPDYSVPSRPVSTPSYNPSTTGPAVSYVNQRGGTISAADLQDLSREQDLRRIRRGEEIEIIEVNQAQLTQKSISEDDYEAMKLGTVVGANRVSKIGRQKGQLTALVQEAQNREVEFQIKAAQNRRTKAETRKKYGF